MLSQHLTLSAFIAKQKICNLPVIKFLNMNNYKDWQIYIQICITDAADRQLILSGLSAEHQLIIF